jgi:putative membrane-bound dehydrogenase-like protein
MNRRCFSLVALALAACATRAPKSPPNESLVGVSRIDITPDTPVRLHGFGFRRAESEGVRQKLWAKALAIGEHDPVVLICTDNLGVPDALVERLAERLKQKAGLPRERLAVTATHTHTAPMLVGVAPTIFGTPIPPDHLQRLVRYTLQFEEKLERVALEALADRKLARLSWAIGRVGFAANRRTRGGPVDHDLPMLAVHDPNGALRAVSFSYACHCVTLSDNLVGGDWAGFAQEHVERAHPGAVALAAVGCGADANPSSGVTGAKAEIASQQGLEIAAEVDRLLAGPLRPLGGPVVAKLDRIDLPLRDPPTRAQWEELAKKQDAVGHHARVNLTRLERGEPLASKIDYPIQSWSFGHDAAMVFLAGEVVVDYALRLKRELDGRRLWINAYANAAPCYIPSERVLQEGGYEAGGANVYYDLPAWFAPGLEQKIVDTVRAQIGAAFAPSFDPTKTHGSRPLAPETSLALIRTKPGLTVELVAAEPLVNDPVAIDFGPDGALWVVEMCDYPAGIDGRYGAGGRIRRLVDRDGDGTYDAATVFLDGIPFPTGVTVWRGGVLICAAPDILYAEDTDGDGKADVRRTLFSGFGTGNYQARVNSLEYGLDGWVYGSCGIFGGVIRSFSGTEPVPLGDRDFRIDPDAGILQPASGRTQQGRVRNDWGDWFGCDNSTLCRHYPLPDHYLRRNPHAAAARTAALVSDDADANRLIPATQLQLFKLSGPPGIATAACGIEVYRDELLGPEYTGNVFVCESVNLLVHRLVLGPRGSTFVGRRAPDETDAEFLASTDPWFRPVQARTGPDGALWIVDMYRYVIEHPRWIPRADLLALDLRAGHGMGRIYRVRPRDRPPRPIPRLDRLDTAGLVAALESPNGRQRDMATQLLRWRADASAVPALQRQLASPRPETRLHALCLLDGLGGLSASIVRRAMTDAHPGVRRHAVRLSEKFIHEDAVLAALLNLVDDPDAQVRLQLALSLGERRDDRGGAALARLARAPIDDSFLVSAALSSLHPGNAGAVLASLLSEADPPAALVHQILASAAAMSDERALGGILSELTRRQGAWRLPALAGVLDALERRGELSRVAGDERIFGMLSQARQTAADESLPASERQAATALLGRLAGLREADRATLVGLLTPSTPGALQGAALSALERIPDAPVADALVAAWKNATPSVQSRILDVLLSREPWQRRLREAVERDEIPAGTIDATRRARLGVDPRPDTRKLVGEYEDVARMAGDASRGRAVFGRICAACHRLEDQGHAVGPDLAALTDKSPAFLLVAILDPNRDVDARYTDVVAITRDGRIVAGLLAGETSTSVTLKDLDGVEHTFLRSELAQLRNSGRSHMPEGLERGMTRQELADVMAYVGGAGPRPKAFAGNRPEVVRPEGGALALRATNAEIYGEHIMFEEPFRNIGLWHGLGDCAIWTVELERDATFDVWLDWACDDGAAGNAYVLEGAAQPLKGKVPSTGGWDRYRREKIGPIALGAGRRRLKLRPDGASLRGALLDLRTIWLVPPGGTPP